MKQLVSDLFKEGTRTFVAIMMMRSDEFSLWATSILNNLTDSRYDRVKKILEDFPRHYPQWPESAAIASQLVDLYRENYPSQTFSQLQMDNWVLDFYDDIKAELELRSEEISSILSELEETAYEEV